MKEFKGIIARILIISVVFLWMPGKASAAWTYEQLFNGLTLAALNGQDSWTLCGVPTQMDVVSTDSPYEGTQHVKYIDDAGGSTCANRGIGTHTSGEFYVSVKGSATASGYLLIQGLDGSNVIGPYLGLYQNNISYGAGLTTLQARTADTYYRIGVRFEATTGGFEGLSQYQAAINVDGGSWTTFAFNNNIASITQLKMNGFSPTGAIVWYFDSISPNFNVAGVAATVSGVMPYGKGNNPMSGGGSFMF